MNIININTYRSARREMRLCETSPSPLTPNTKAFLCVCLMCGKRGITKLRISGI